MEEKQNTEIFLPVTFKIYKENKINLLKIQLKTINTEDRIKRLEKLKKLKSEQRRHLKTIIKEMKQEYSTLLKSLPGVEETNQAESISPPTSPQKISPEIEHHTDSKIDAELNKIQEKLNNLKL